MKKILFAGLMTTGFLYAGAQQSWQLTGNANINRVNNFIGTTDDNDVIFRRGNIRAGLLGNNTSFGVGALRLDGGTGNVAIGPFSLYNNTGGNNNVTLGINALYSNTIGANNIAIGLDALYDNTTGVSNIGIGTQTLSRNVSGASNIAIGNFALNGNSTGYRNIGIGQSALQTNTDGFDNIAMGESALSANKTGGNNIGIGKSTLRFNTAGHGNIAIGKDALYYNTTSYYNIAIGTEALKNNQTGISNSAIGAYALLTNTTGVRNTAIGSSALYYNLDGSNNTAHGADALSRNISGNNNTVAGYQVMFNNRTGQSNTAAGAYALWESRDGIYNTANGYNALRNGTGHFNSGNGSYSLFTNTTGSYNTAAGYSADVNGTNYSNATAIGAFTVATGSDQVRLGNAYVTSIGGHANWTNLSDGRFKKNIQENVPGLSFIKQLKPVTYNLDVTGIQKHLAPTHASDSTVNTAFPDARTKAAIAQKEQIVYTGFIAQDVEAIAKKMNYSFSGVDAPEPGNEKSTYGLRYAEFVVPLVKAVQELSFENEGLKKEVEQLQAQMQQVIQALQKDKNTQPVNGSMAIPGTLADFKVFPNPTTGSFMISANYDIKDAATQLYDMSGKAQNIIVTNIDNNRKEIKLKNASKGIYLLKLMTANKTVSVQVAVQ